MLYNNETVVMTRRYPNLSKKVLRRDSEIVKKIMISWDVEKSSEKVLSIFLKEQNNLSDERYWEILRSVWIISGGVNNVDVFKKLMLSGRKDIISALQKMQKNFVKCQNNLKFIGQEMITTME